MRVSQRRVRIILTTGLKRQIRGMFLGMGFRVTKLVRVRIGSLWGGDLPVGKHAELTGREIALLRSNPPLQKGFRINPLKPSEKSAAKKNTHKRSSRKFAKKITIKRRKR